MTPRALLATLSVPVLLAGGAAADTVWRAAGEPLTGRVFSEDATGVKLHVYNSPHPRNCFGVEWIPKAQLVKVDRSKPPEEEYWDRALALKGEDAAGHAALAAWCKSKGLRLQATDHAERALWQAADNAEARKLLGESAAKRFLEEKVREEEVWKPLLRKYIAASPGERPAIAKELKAAKFAHPQAYLDRLARSATQPKGKTEDRRLTYRSAQIPGAVYTSWVPEDYDPLRTYPLVLGLHGGGPGGKDGKEVVGSGKLALPLYLPVVRERGYIMVCPTALGAWWQSFPKNEPMLEAVLLETALLYHVDLNRVYLIGHSMGGGGTWWYGPEKAETFVAIAPLSAFSSQGFARLHETRTPCYIYHGTKDDRCPVESARTAAKALKKLRAEHIYTELPDTGHSCPIEVVKEAFDLFDHRRLAPAAKPTLFFKTRATPWGERSSFLLPLEREEADDLGGITAPGSGGTPKEATIRELVEKLLKGGEVAEQAAAEIAAHAERVKAVKPLCELLLRDKNPDVRHFSAVALGGVGDPAAIPHLGQACSDEATAVRAAAVEALGKIRDPKSRPPLLAALEGQKSWFDKRFQGSKMDATDWEGNLQFVDGLLAALRSVADASVAKAVDKHVVEGMALREVSVMWDKVAHKDPRVSRRQLAVIAAKFFQDVALPEGGPALDRLEGLAADTALIEDGGKLLEVVAAARAAIAAAPTGTAPAK
ncbi:MAG: HEAT repeat domain-containing protein [Planctomycetales bacterium]|nr:HEAT repeat domain-containing protein [Planctomycetales bacterium]